MSYLSAILKNAQAVGINPGSASYFSAPAEQLDPRLFIGTEFRLTVREQILQLLFSHLSNHFRNAEDWTHAWLAGSGVSYQWEAAREPGDLDCLVGIEYTNFRKYNPDLAGLSNAEIAAMMNESFVKELWPRTASFMGTFELTFYVNPATNILDINPYAAYNLIDQNWAVEPTKGQSAPVQAKWESQAQNDYTNGVIIVDRYAQALSEVRNATNPAHRVNAERRLNMAIEQAADLFELIHHGRKAAFSQTGAGYGDWNNYRWQAGKRSGIIQTLRKIKDYRDQAQSENTAETYGVELPDARTLIRRTALRRVKG